MRPAQRFSVNTNGRGSSSSRAASRTTARPMRRPLAMLTMSPRRSEDSASLTALLRCSRDARDWAFSRCEIAARIRAYASIGASRPPSSAAISSSIRSPRSMARTRPTTERSAWYCAKDRSSSLCACVGPIWFTRLIVMLYDGANELRSGNVLVDARPATSAGSTSGVHSTTAWPSTSMPRRPARPVNWVYSPGVNCTCCSPSNFTRRSRTTVRAGMLMPKANVSVANTALTKPLVKSSSTV